MRFQPRRRRVEPEALNWRRGELPLVVQLHSLFTDGQAMADVRQTSGIPDLTPWRLMNSPRLLNTRGYTYAQYVNVHSLIELLGYDLVMELGISGATVLSRLQPPDEDQARRSVTEAFRQWIRVHDGHLPGYSACYRIARNVAPMSVPFGNRSGVETAAIRAALLAARSLLREWPPLAGRPRSNALVRYLIRRTSALLEENV